jgi:hypothetical protein
MYNNSVEELEREKRSCVSMHAKRKRVYVLMYAKCCAPFSTQLCLTKTSHNGIKLSSLRTQSLWLLIPHPTTHPSIILLWGKSWKPLEDTLLQEFLHPTSSISAQSKPCITTCKFSIKKKQGCIREELTVVFSCLLHKNWLLCWFTRYTIRRHV